MDAVYNISLKLRGAASSSSATDERIDKQFQATIASLTKSAVQDIVVASGTTDIAVSFGSVATAKLVAIFATGDLSIKVQTTVGVTPTWDAEYRKIGKVYLAANSAAITGLKLKDESTASNPVTVVLAE